MARMEGTHTLKIAFVDKDRILDQLLKKTFTYFKFFFIRILMVYRCKKNTHI